MQRADILGARTFAMRIWLKPDRMAALNVSPVQTRQALAANNYQAAVGQTKGVVAQGNLTTKTTPRALTEFGLSVENPAPRCIPSPPRSLAYT